MTAKIDKEQVTIHEVAEYAGVSIATVSRVISGKVGVSAKLTQRVEEAILVLGYHPNDVARSLKERKTKCIGLIIPSVENPFFPSLVRGVEDACQQAGYAVFLCNTDGIEEIEIQYIASMAGKQVDGILFTPGFDRKATLTALQKTNLPVVLLDRKLSGAKFPFVTVDNAKGAYDAVIHLIECGAKRIGHIRGRKGLSTSLQREEGYRKALIDHGIKMHDDWIIDGNYTFESGLAGAKVLVEQVGVDSIFAANDMMAFGCLEYASQQKINVPENLLIIGFDDVRLASWYKPALSTIHQPVYDMGFSACNILLNLMEGNTVVDEQYFRPELVVRQSTGIGKREVVLK